MLLVGFAMGAFATHRAVRYISLQVDNGIDQKDVKSDHADNEPEVHCINKPATEEGIEILDGAEGRRSTEDSTKVATIIGQRASAQTSHRNNDDSRNLAQDCAATEVIEIDDLEQLGRVIYDNECERETDVPTTSIEPDSSATAIDSSSPWAADPTIDSFFQTIHDIVNHSLPETSYLHKFREKRAAAYDIRGVQRYLKPTVCRFAIRQDRFDVFEKNCRGLNASEYRDLMELAIEYGSIEVYKELSEKPGALKKDEALELAAYHNSCGVLNHLLQDRWRDTSVGTRIEDPNVNGTKETHPLTAAIYHGNLEAVKILIREGAQVNVRDARWSLGETYPNLVFAAATEGHNDVLKVLLEAGASLREPDSQYDAFSIALEEQDRYALICLMTFGAAASERRDVLDNVLRIGGPSLSILALEAGANPNIRDVQCWGYHETPFHMACSQGEEETVRAFLKHGVNIDGPPRAPDIWSGKTPIDAAAQNGHDDVVVLLESHGAKVNKNIPWREWKIAPLVESGDLQRLKALLERYPDININHPDGMYYSPLCNAMRQYLYRPWPVEANRQQRYLTMMELLLRKGARLSKRDVQFWNSIPDLASEVLPQLFRIAGELKVWPYPD